MTEYLRFNDQGLSELYLMQNPDSYGCSRFANSCQWIDNLSIDNTENIQSIYWDGDFLAGLDDDARFDMMSRIGSTSSPTLSLQFQLEKIHLGGARLSALALARMIENTRETLKVLDLCNFTLVGTMEDLDEMTMSLFKHESLQEFILTDFEMENETCCSRHIEHIIKRLLSISTLRVLKLEPKSRGENHQLTVSAVIVAPLCRSQSLVELHLRGWKLSALHISLLCRVMIKANPLQVLKLSDCDMDDAFVSTLATSMHQSHLQVLDLSNNVNLTSKSCQYLADALLCNEHLQVLRLDGCKHITVAGLMDLARMLESNTTLEQLDLPAPATPDRAVVDRMNAVLHQNQQAHGHYNLDAATAA